jgi:4-hydroxythreonine-4-phosphate dehydrogenase
MSVHRLVISSGEPAGIGPDLCLKLMQPLTTDNLALEPSLWRSEWVVLGSGKLFKQRSQHLGFKWQPSAYQADAKPEPGKVVFWDLDDHFATEQALWQDQPGVPQTATASLVLTQLDLAVKGCLKGDFDAFVTGPVQKSVLSTPKQPFTGHTEFLQQHSQASNVVMLLATMGCQPLFAQTADSTLGPNLAPSPSGQSLGMKVALVTTHLPLRAVPKAITHERIIAITELLSRGLKQDFGLPHPRIMILGLNPHAGEDGQLGTEELEIIRPAIERLKAKGINCIGPVPADTAFTPEKLATTDAVLAMYHDQGLTVLKHQGFGRSANITLGLPFVRTSVDHGTALDLAGTGRSDPGGLYTALAFAEQIISNRTQKRN